MALLTGYQRTWLRGDLVAGATVTAIAIPESLGYASIAGLPVQTGLYCALVPAILFALVASSRQLVVGADSATAALVAAGAGAVVASSSQDYPATVAVLGLITAGILLVMAVARLGFLARPDLAARAGRVPQWRRRLAHHRQAPRDARHRCVRHDLGQARRHRDGPR